LFLDPSIYDVPGLSDYFGSFSDWLVDGSDLTAHSFAAPTAAGPLFATTTLATPSIAAPSFEDPSVADPSFTDLSSAAPAFTTPSFTAAAFAAPLAAVTPAGPTFAAPSFAASSSTAAPFAFDHATSVVHRAFSAATDPRERMLLQRMLDDICTDKAPASHLRARPENARQSHWQTVLTHGDEPDSTRSPRRKAFGPLAEPGATQPSKRVAYGPLADETTPAHIDHETVPDHSIIPALSAQRNELAKALHFSEAMVPVFFSKTGRLRLFYAGRQYITLLREERIVFVSLMPLCEIVVGTSSESPDCAKFQRNLLEATGRNDTRTSNG
jgi:hypothetical protein